MSLRTLLIAGASLAALASSAGAQELPQRIRDAGTIVAATNPNYAPIVYKDPATNTLQGLDIALGEAIAEELGVKIEWQETEFVQMLPSLQTGRVDMAMAGMSDLPSRRETVDFVDYMVSGAQFYTLKALSEGVASPADLCGKRVGASRNTNWPKQIGEWSKENCEAKGLAAIEVIGTEGSVDARTQLKSQRLDAAVQGSETLPYFQKLEPDTYVLLGKPFTRSLAGIPFLKTEEGNQIRDAVQGALERLKESGRYSEIFTEYGLAGNEIEAIALNKGE
ncbi:polar amino acid transport system substrate-binding protein [Pseudorhizobium tarimense]|uniref:Polar amino acid transport system substrate-binding protein n=1 Tax=Pseudorhizobium tarimense TaxID=1079109 RepID=A0ABV2HEU5_9HYPH|nr:ABC transporter substrate-binding protein [Pseudorhizobium tarimense]MCJ8521719.1 ABC transporter substrate-binding protein [Pseudorhizobium tarimense]